MERRRELKEELKVFEKELGYIKDEKIREFTVRALEILPSYFWTVPASSSGKYHPSYALGSGGLCRHTKAAVKVAIEMFNLDMFNKYDSRQKDMIISALFLHDGAKSNIPQQKYTAHDHPIIICDYILKHKEVCDILDEYTLNTILDGIKSHMGQWVSCNYSSVVLPEPKTGIQKFIHLCDYIASRKCIEINFEV
jgi:hypothetical protein